jgi:hypothetical protein
MEVTQREKGKESRKTGVTSIKCSPLLRRGPSSGVVKANHAQQKRTAGYSPLHLVAYSPCLRGTYMGSCRSCFLHGHAGPWHLKLIQQEISSSLDPVLKGGRAGTTNSMLQSLAWVITVLVLENSGELFRNIIPCPFWYGYGCTTSPQGMQEQSYTVGRWAAGVRQTLWFS